MKKSLVVSLMLAGLLLFVASAPTLAYPGFPPGDGSEEPGIGKEGLTILLSVCAVFTILGLALRPYLKRVLKPTDSHLISAKSIRASVFILYFAGVIFAIVDVGYGVTRGYMNIGSSIFGFLTFIVGTQARDETGMVKFIQYCGLVMGVVMLGYAVIRFVL